MMASGQPMPPWTPNWFRSPDGKQLCFYDSATDELVNQDGTRYRRPSYFQVPYAAQSPSRYGGSQAPQTFSATPRHLSSPFPGYVSGSSIQSPSYTNYTPSFAPSAGHWPSTPSRTSAFLPHSHSSPSAVTAGSLRLSIDGNSPNVNSLSPNGQTDRPRGMDRRWSQHSQGSIPSAPPRNLGRSEELLDKAFHRHKTPRNFFKPGKVFHTLFSEAADDSSSVTRSRAFTVNSYGELIHSKVRRFVVVKEGTLSCIAIPITTYGGQGVAKAGVKKSDHAIIHSGKIAPLPLPDERADIAAGEAGMQPHAIRVEPDSKGVKLDPMSRIDFGKPSTIHHNVKIKHFGMVHSSSLTFLIMQYQNVSIGHITGPNELESFRRSSWNAASTPSTAQYTRAMLALVRDGWARSEATSFLAPVKAVMDGHENRTADLDNDVLEEEEVESDDEDDEIDDNDTHDNDTHDNEEVNGLDALNQLSLTDSRIEAQ